VSDREKARRALKQLELIREKRAEQRRLEIELRHSLEHQAYDSRHKRAGYGPNRIPPKRSTGPHACAACGWEFVPGEEVLEYLDDDGQVVSRYHFFKEECRRAGERSPEARMRYT
jgi:hypothetical protein